MVGAARFRYHGRATSSVDSILNRRSFEAAIFHRVATRLKNDIVGVGVIVDAFYRATEASPSLIGALPVPWD